MTDAREKRKHQRASVNWPVVVVTPQRYLGGKARNISLGGAALIFNRDPGSHELLRLAIKIPTGNELVQTTGIVVWSKLKVQPKDLYGCQTGIRFTSFMGKSRQYLDEAISECLGLK